uniref:Uncharacterized protein n=1 Tax=Anguilla anguilla TaxID=7936 RepID=A0A0E9R692_ANGAN
MPSRESGSNMGLSQCYNSPTHS